MRPFGQPRLGAGGFNGLIDHLDMTKGVNRFLGYEDFVADGAMRAFGNPRLGTGGVEARIDLLGMTKGVNRFLGYEDFVTDGAMRALGKSRLGTGGIKAPIGNRGVSERGNHGLGGKHRITIGAMLPFGQTRGGARGHNGFVNHLVVTTSGNRSLRHKDRLANRTMLALAQAGGGARSINGGIDHLGMTECGENLGNDVSTGAGLTTASVGRTGSLLHRPLSIFVFVRLCLRRGFGLGGFGLGGSGRGGLGRGGLGRIRFLGHRIRGFSNHIVAEMVGHEGDLAVGHLGGDLFVRCLGQVIHHGTLRRYVIGQGERDGNVAIHRQHDVIIQQIHIIHVGMIRIHGQRRDDGLNRLGLSGG